MARQERAQRKPWRHGVYRCAAATTRLALHDPGTDRTEAQEQVDRLNRLRGIGRDILICRNKDSTDLGRDTIWGLLAEPITQRKIEGRGAEGMYEIEIEVWDRV